MRPALCGLLLCCFGAAAYAQAPGIQISPAFLPQSLGPGASPSFVGMTLSGTLNKLTITPPATGATLTIADGKTATDTSGVGAVALAGTAGGGFAQAASTGLSDVTAPTSFAPALTFGGGATGLTYAGSNAGIYTKFDKTVTWQFLLDVATPGSSTGQASLALPPAAANSGVLWQSGSCSRWANNQQTAFGINLVLSNTDSAHADLFYVDATGATLSVTNTFFNGAGVTVIVCAVTYVAQ